MEPPRQLGGHPAPGRSTAQAGGTLHNSQRPSHFAPRSPRPTPRQSDCLSSQLRAPRPSGSRVPRLRSLTAKNECRSFRIYYPHRSARAGGPAKIWGAVEPRCAANKTRMPSPAPFRWGVDYPAVVRSSSWWCVVAMVPGHRAAHDADHSAGGTTSIVCRRDRPPHRSGRRWRDDRQP